MRLLLVGGGGHCRAAIDVIEADERWQIAGIVDPGLPRGETLLGYPVVGGDEELPALCRKYDAALVTLGTVGDTDGRRRLFKRLRELGFRLPAIASPLARVSPHARLGDGTLVMHQALVNACARIGTNALIQSAALVEHDVEIGDHACVSTAAVVNGGARIGAGAFIGSHATVLQGLRVAAGAVVGAGAVVTRDLQESGTYLGVPARRVEPTMPVSR